jgi:hypothetical protein
MTQGLGESFWSCLESKEHHRTPRVPNWLSSCHVCSDHGLSPPGYPAAMWGVIQDMPGNSVLTTTVQTHDVARENCTTIVFRHKASEVQCSNSLTTLIGFFSILSARALTFWKNLQEASPIRTVHSILIGGFPVRETVSGSVVFLMVGQLLEPCEYRCWAGRMIVSCHTLVALGS